MCPLTDNPTPMSLVSTVEPFSGVSAEVVPASSTPIGLTVRCTVAVEEKPPASVAV